MTKKAQSANDHCYEWSKWVQAGCSHLPSSAASSPSSLFSFGESHCTTVPFHLFRVQPPWWTETWEDHRNGQMQQWCQPLPSLMPVTTVVEDLEGTSRGHCWCQDKTVCLLLCLISRYFQFSLGWHSSHCCPFPSCMKRKDTAALYWIPVYPGASWSLCVRHWMISLSVESYCISMWRNQFQTHTYTYKIGPWPYSCSVI